MPKPSLKEPYRTLESHMVATLRAGLKEWRPDLDHPESYSDWQACVRGLLKMYHIERLPIGLSDKDLVEEVERR